MPFDSPSVARETWSIQTLPRGFSLDRPEVALRCRWAGRTSKVQVGSSVQNFKFLNWQKLPLVSSTSLCSGLWCWSRFQLTNFYTGRDWTFTTPHNTMAISNSKAACWSRPNSNILGLAMLGQPRMEWCFGSFTICGAYWGTIYAFGKGVQCNLSWLLPFINPPGDCGLIRQAADFLKRSTNASAYANPQPIVQTWWRHKTMVSKVGRNWFWHDW